MRKKRIKGKKAIGYTFLVAGITALFCVALFLLVGYRFFLKQDIAFEEDQTLAQMEVEAETISIPGFETWTIDGGTTTVSTHFYNPESNQCYFKISILLDDTGKCIYESKYIKPGQDLYEVELSEGLEVGTYPATLHYSTYSPADLEPLNGADVPFELVVK